MTKVLKNLNEKEKELTKVQDEINKELIKEQKEEEKQKKKIIHICF